MRLLFITPNFPPHVGGMQNYSLELACELAQRCEVFTAVAPRLSKIKTLTWKDTTVPFVIHRMGQVRDGMALSAILSLRRLLNSQHFDAIFVTHWSAAFGALAAQYGRQKLPLFCAAHGKEVIHQPFSHFIAAQHVYDTMRYRALQHSTLICPVSRYTAKLVHSQGIPTNNIQVINNGVDAARFCPQPSSTLRHRLKLENKLILLSIGRLVARKGVDTVLQTLPHLITHFPTLCYLVVGKGPESDALKKLAHSLGVASHVRFVHDARHNELPTYYNLCDLFVMPARNEGSDIEGFGLVFLEASACGKAVVGAHAGGVPDAIVDGKTGVLVQPGNHIELGKALKTLLASPEQRNELGAQGRKHVLACMTWQRVADELMKAMQSRLK